MSVYTSIYKRAENKSCLNFKTVLYIVEIVSTSDDPSKEAAGLSSYDHNGVWNFLRDGKWRD